MDLTVRTESFTSEDQSWLGSAHGTDAADSITLDGATLGAIFVDGVVPSGVALGLITATGKYGPYLATAGDGRQNFSGVLLNTVTLRQSLRGDPTSTYHDVGGALLFHGEVIVARLPANSGVDAAAQVSTGAKLIRFV